MSEMSNTEAMRAAREARDRVASAPRTSSTRAVEAAMTRYLSAEQYRELSEETRTADDDRTAGEAERDD